MCCDEESESGKRVIMTSDLEPFEITNRGTPVFGGFEL